MVAEKLGKLLVNTKLVAEDQLQAALATQKREGGRLGSVLIRLGFIGEEALLGVLSRQCGVPCVNLTDAEIDPGLMKLIPQDALKKYLVFPIKRVGSTLSLAMVDPTDVFAIDDIKFLTSYNIEPYIASEASIIAKINQCFGGGGAAPLVAERKAVSIDAKDYTLKDDGTGDQGEGIDESLVSVEDFDAVVGNALDEVDVAEEQQDDKAVTDVGAPIIKLVNGILVNGINVGASDIHVEPYETVLRIRFRIDGVLKTVMSLPVKIKNAVVSRLKIMAKLDIAERRLPQDGRIKLKLGRKHDIDFRVACLPSLFGEKVVLRILDKSNLQLKLDHLGFEAKALADFREALNAPYGMILVTGPTGSGKTTTLYAAINSINSTDVNIMTAEDPVEYNLMGINQVQVNEEIGLTFAAALRSFLRQDPDVVLVGEVRDQNTVEIAIKAALTGHLVLSTLHTNDAPGTITRLLNMGVAPFLVSSSLILILAQRLARKICTQCKEVDPSCEVAFLSNLFKKRNLDGLTVYKGRGCPACNQSGYKGRVALYEVFRMTDELRSMILRGATIGEIKAQAIALGMQTLRMSGLEKIRAGITTPSEVAQNTAEDECVAMA